jgi:MFS family permease
MLASPAHLRMERLLPTADADDDNDDDDDGGVNGGVHGLSSHKRTLLTVHHVKRNVALHHRRVTADDGNNSNSNDDDDDDDDGGGGGKHAIGRDAMNLDYTSHVAVAPPSSPDPAAHVAVVEERDGVGEHQGVVRLEPITWTLWSAAAVAAIGGFLFGYDIGIISGALLQLRDEFHLDDNESEAVVGSLMVGALLGSATGGVLCDGVGRRNVIVANAVLFIVAALWLAASTSVAMIIAARVLAGYAVSLSAIAECVYISEIAPASRRGQLVSLNELGITLGILAAFGVNAALINLPDGWRIMFGLATVPATVQLVWMSRLPQSPRWLLMKGRRAEALAALRKFRAADPFDEIDMIPLMDLVPPGCDDDDDDDDGADRRKRVVGGADSDGNAPRRVTAELDKIAAAAAAHGSTRFIDLLRTPVLRKALAIGCTLVLLQQLTGQPSLLLYVC